VPTLPQDVAFLVGQRLSELFEALQLLFFIHNLK
jgi:hypothetical protein